MAYTTKKCPHCGKMYSITQSKNIAGYGSPFRLCKSCGKTFFDQDYSEIAIHGIRKVDKRRFSFGFVIFLIFCLLVTLFGVFTANKQVIIGGLALCLLFAWCIYTEAAKFDERQAWLAKETQASKDRLKDETYRQALRELGYEVPEEMPEEMPEKEA